MCVCVCSVSTSFSVCVCVEGVAAGKEVVRIGTKIVNLRGITDVEIIMKVVS